MREPLSAEARAAHLATIRAKAEADMAAIGIDRDFIDRLVETFYERIRDHAVLGPVFEARLAGRWEQHLAKMKRFWGAMAFKDGAYGGKPMAAHQAIPGLTPSLFGQWLALFNATLVDIAPSARAHDWFMTSADRIARSMVTALFAPPSGDTPSDPGPAPDRESTP